MGFPSNTDFRKRTYWLQCVPRKCKTYPSKVNTHAISIHTDISISVSDTRVRNLIIKISLRCLQRFQWLSIMIVILRLQSVYVYTTQILYCCRHDRQNDDPYTDYTILYILVHYPPITNLFKIWFYSRNYIFSPLVKR